MVVAAARTHTIDTDAHGREIPSQADLVLRLAWFAATISVHGQQTLDQVRAAHADALAAVVEAQWRMRDAARDQVARVNGALADACAEMPTPPYGACAENVRGRRSLLVLMRR
jgi:hypothetical protein